MSDIDWDAATELAFDEQLQRKEWSLDDWVRFYMWTEGFDRDEAEAYAARRVLEEQNHDTLRRNAA